MEISRMRLRRPQWPPGGLEGLEWQDGEQRAHGPQKSIQGRTGAFDRTTCL